MVEWRCEPAISSLPESSSEFENLFSIELANLFACTCSDTTLSILLSLAVCCLPGLSEACLSISPPSSSMAKQDRRCPFAVMACAAVGSRMSSFPIEGELSWAGVSLAFAAWPGSANSTAGGLAVICSSLSAYGLLPLSLTVLYFTSTHTSRVLAPSTSELSSSRRRLIKLSGWSCNSARSFSSFCS